MENQTANEMERHRANMLGLYGGKGELLHYDGVYIGVYSRVKEIIALGL